MQFDLRKFIVSGTKPYAAEFQCDLSAKDFAGARIEPVSYTHLGRLTMETPVPVSEHAYHMGGSQIWLEPGEHFTLDLSLIHICEIRFRRTN